MKKVLTVSVIGDSMLPNNHKQYKLAEELGKCLIDNDYRIIHGGRKGVMEAVTCGAKKSEKYIEGRVIGILPGFYTSGKNDYLDVAVATGLNVMRNAIVVNTDAVIAIGGGAGTLSEMALAWTMGKLIIAYNNVEGWSGKLAGQKIDNKKRIEQDWDKIFSVNDASEVIQLLDKYIPFYYDKRKTIG